MLAEPAGDAWIKTHDGMLAGVARQRGRDRLAGFLYVVARLRFDLDQQRGTTCDQCEQIGQRCDVLVTFAIADRFKLILRARFSLPLRFG